MWCRETLSDRRTDSKEVGADFGLKKFLSFSDGSVKNIPPFYSRLEKKIAEIQVRLSKKKKNSNNYKRVLKELERVYIKMDNSKKDFFFKYSRELCSTHSLICIEDLDMKEMQSNYGKDILNLSFSTFVSILEYTALKYGTKIVKVPRYYPSSQICSSCSYVEHSMKDLSKRMFICPKCGNTLDRDYNASVNILKKGKEIISTPPF